MHWYESRSEINAIAPNRSNSDIKTSHYGGEFAAQMRLHPLLPRYKPRFTSIKIHVNVPGLDKLEAVTFFYVLVDPVGIRASRLHSACNSCM